MSETITVIKWAGALMGFGGFLTWVVLVAMYFQRIHWINRVLLYILWWMMAGPAVVFIIYSLRQLP